jgi:shikimate dehydrogenase
MSLSGKARLAGVVGFPVAHSLSPLLHGFWLHEHKIDGVYVPLPVRTPDFSIALEGLRTAGFVGVNVTVPHKEAAFSLAETVDETARLAGAVNLLLLHDQGIEGRNTDVEGLSASLAEELGNDPLKTRAVLVLGAGGGARAAVLAGARLHAVEIRIASRNDERSHALVRSLQPRLATRLVSVPWNARYSATQDAHLLINTTSAGMVGHPLLDMSLDRLSPGAAVCDIVYNPLQTGLLRAAKARGLLAIDGLGMLLHQAVPAFEAFYGIRPIVSVALRLELERALANGV